MVVSPSVVVFSPFWITPCDIPLLVAVPPYHWMPLLSMYTRFPSDAPIRIHALSRSYTVE